MTTITWKEAVNGGSQIIKLDDRRGSWPAEGDEEVLNGRRYKVVGLEHAEVLLEPLEPAPADPPNPAMKDGKPLESKAVVQARLDTKAVDAGADPVTLGKRNTRVAERRADEEEAEVEAEKAPVKAGPASKHPDFKPAPKHLAQHRTRDPLRAHKVASHKKK